MTSTTDAFASRPNNAAGYVEFGLQATTETCIRDVSAVLAYHAAATAADNGKTSIFDGASETVVFGGDMSQTGLQYKSAVVTPAAASWNRTAVNGLVARRLLDRLEPDPCWDSIVLEAAVD